MTLSTALLSCTALGLQHGIDWDHVAAISDVASFQRTSHEARVCGLLYAVGHAATVGILGIAAILLRRSLPEIVSAWMQRFVGITLILLGVYVFMAILSRRGVVSRGQAIRILLRRIRPTRRSGVAEDDRGYGPKSSLSLGILHGIGAETPTQLSMLMIATNLGGIQKGALGLAVFTAAMLVSNIGLTTVATGMFSISRLSPTIYKWLGTITAAYSLWIGFVLIQGF